MRKLALILASALALASPVMAAEEGHIEDVAFPWEGPFGKFDQFQLQRGLQIYTDVCSGCHGLQYVPIRTLADPGGPGLPEDQVRAYATAFTVLDEDSNHQLYDPEAGALRPLLPSDNFPANHSAGAPDLSLMAKARAGFHGPYGLGINQFLRGIGGPEYIHAILTGYTGEEKEEAGTTLYENTAFPGGWIAMAPPLSDELVEFDPAHANDLDSLSMDVSAFLTWAAEPKMMARKQTGFLAVGFLILLTALLYLTNKRLWAPHKGKKHA
jgi:ubiquinol-cytochrome c reductase cytochrome c1 subunit